jgi:tRNA pseudouridine38-40 synthase
MQTTAATGSEQRTSGEFAIAEYQIELPTGLLQATQTSEHVLVHRRHSRGFEPILEEVAKDDETRRCTGRKLIEKIREGIHATVEVHITRYVEHRCEVRRARCKVRGPEVHGRRAYGRIPTHLDGSIGLTAAWDMLWKMRFALLIAYDGTDFSGWWRQPDSRTVAGIFDEAFARIGEPQAHVVGASRTDAGVHAEGQVAHVTLTRRWDAEVLRRALATHLPADVACRLVTPVADDWDACHAASGKTYRYTIDHGEVPDPFLARFAWRTPFRLEPQRLMDATVGIAGERDWSGFSRRGETRHLDGDLVRRIDQVAWSQEGQRLCCEVTGGGFTYRLVRSLVGAMVAVANETCSRAELDAALAGHDSSAGRQQAPARGLCLVRVTYATTIFV